MAKFSLFEAIDKRDNKNAYWLIQDGESAEGEHRTQCAYLDPKNWPLEYIKRTTFAKPDRILYGNLSLFTINAVDPVLRGKWEA